MQKVFYKIQYTYMVKPLEKSWRECITLSKKIHTHTHTHIHTPNTILNRGILTATPIKSGISTLPNPFQPSF